MKSVHRAASRLLLTGAGLCLALALIAASGAKADPGNCPTVCAPYASDQAAYEECVAACLAGMTYCGPGTVDCSTYKTEGECYPGFYNKCHSSNPNCGCRWKYVGGSDKCVCQNITGK